MAQQAKRGSISGTKKDGYRYELDIGGGRDSRQRVVRRGFTTKAEAQDALNLILAEQTQGTFVAATNETVGGYMDRWLEQVEPTLAESTFDGYKRKIRCHVVPRLGSIKLQDLDALTLNAFYADLLDEGRKDGKGGLAPKHVNNIATIIGKALNDAVRWGLLQRNPAPLADPPKGKSLNAPGHNTWSADQVGGFLKECAAMNDRYLALWRLLATTGMRRGEALGLRWSDLDLGAGTASIAQTLLCVDHKRLFSTTKTVSGARLIDLDGGTIELLQRHKRRQAAELLAAGIGKQDHDLVFTQRDGSWTHPDRISREFFRRIDRFERILDRGPVNSRESARVTAVDIPKIRLHDLRHTWATLAMRSGVPPKVVQERLGHAKISITLDIYSHVLPGMQREAADLIAGAFDA